MNEKIAELEVVSSELGNQWLAQMKAAAPNVFLDSHQIKAVALPEVVFNVPKSEPTDSLENEAVTTGPSLGATDCLGEENCEIENRDSEGRDEDKSEPRLEQSVEDAEIVVVDPEIDVVAEQILKRFDGEKNIVLIVAGCEKGLETGETCTRIAGALAQKRVGDVLLIDAEIDAKTMTNQSGLNEEDGLTNFLLGQSEWDVNLFTQSAIPLSFLCAGNAELGPSSNAKSNVRRLVNEARDQFRFVCVSVGDAHQPGAEFWMSSCSGSYLVVDVDRTNKTIARSAVTVFQDAGAEVLGCLVTSAK